MSEEKITFSDKFESQENIPLDEKELDELSGKTKVLLQVLSEQEILKKEVSDKLKMITGDLVEVTRAVAKKAVLKTVNVFWRYDWDAGKKELIHNTESGEAIVLREAEITERDGKQELPLNYDDKDDSPKEEDLNVEYDPADHVDTVFDN